MNAKARSFARDSLLILVLMILKIQDLGNSAQFFIHFALQKIHLDKFMFIIYKNFVDIKYNER